MNPLKEVTLTNLVGGAAVEIFQRELGVVSKNIADPNTDKKKSRKITLTVTITPSENSDEVAMSVSAKSTLASVKPASKTIYMGKINGVPTLVGQDPVQGTFNFGNEVTPIVGARNA